MRRAPHAPRRGALALESAFTLSVLFFLLLSIVIGGYGIFRYQQLALLAREAARYASVHGGLYAEETGSNAAAQQDVLTNAVLPLATNLDPASLECSVSWSTNNMPSHMTADYEKPVTNTVTVTLTYQWLPELFRAGPVTLSSSSTVPMSY